MNYELEIKIKKSEVLAEVDKTLSYTGKRTLTQDGGNEYGHIWTNKYDSEMMERFIAEAEARLVLACHDFVSAQETTDEAFTVTYCLPETHNEAVDWSVRQMMFSFIVWYVLSRWFRVCGMEAVAQSYLETAKLFLKRAGDSLYSQKLTRAKEWKERDNNAFGGTRPQNYGEVNVEFYPFENS